MRIVVLGAGYSGLAAAGLAARWTGARVTLVNDRDRFVERVRLHEVAAGRAPRRLPLSKMLDGRGVELVLGRVTGIDPDARAVTVQGRSEPVRYDRLIYALGSTADPDPVPGAAEHAFTVARPDEAARLAERVAGLARAGAVTPVGGAPAAVRPDGGDRPSVVVVGAGLTGIEAATELAESHPRLEVTLVTAGTLGDTVSARGARYLRRVTDRLGVRVVEHTTVVEVRADGAVTGDGTLLAGTVVWTTGFRVPELAGLAGLAVDGRGRILVDPTLRSLSHPDVTAVGDAAVLRRTDGAVLRMACATAAPSARKGVRAMADRAAGRDPRSLRFRYLNQCISLGRRDALVQFVRSDDSPVELILTGRFAALYKEAIVRGVLAWERRPQIPMPG